MKRLCLALSVAFLLLLVVGVGTAAADVPGSQDAGQLAGSDQGAGAAAGTAQLQPTNDNSAVDVLSPGDAGSVEQTNNASSNATAGNLNATSQDADQDQEGSGIQAIGQSAKNDQDALALAFTLQEGASNTNAPVDVLGKGKHDDKGKHDEKDENGAGAVTQDNTASSEADAGNLNLTGQEADQDQESDCKCEGSGGTQAIGQSAKNDQDATAVAKTGQVKPSNTNISVRVLSPGDDGPVTQTNTATSDAKAGNINLTKQDADQKQEGDDCRCKGDGGTQGIGQSADSEQDATALAKTVQEKPSNKNISVRVLSPGDDGPVTQTNTATSDAKAGNINLTKQDADQKQDGGSGTQAIGQKADSDQKALAASLTAQKGADNKNISVRVLSPGDGGSVTQTNTATSDATAGNVNLTKQDADQKQEGDCKCGGDGSQFVGQFADNDQKAAAAAATFQVKPSNTNTSIRVLSKGDDGDVSQTNEATSNAFAGNLNLTKQDADQKQEGDCKCGGDGKQVIGQFADNDQKAAAAAATFQVKPSNTNTSIRVLSKGDDGDVSQTNEATSNAFAGNLNLTKQDADQKQDGGSGIQVIGQAAKNEQDAFALGLTFQDGASNSNTPVRVLSKGDGGSVTQANTASSNAAALNVNLTKQDADQKQGGRKHEDSKHEDGKHEDGHDCCGTGIQAIGQFAKNDQNAKAVALTVQSFKRPPCTCDPHPAAGNSNSPVRVLSKGDDGDVSQANTASSDAAALNFTLTKQDADQKQDPSCKCWEAFGIQAIGQLSESEQDAAALAATFQLGASNANKPESHGEHKPDDHHDPHASGMDME
jgi:ribosomal protein L24